MELGQALGLEKGLLFRLAIAIELSIVVLALILPRPGWVLVALQYAIFLVILASLVAAGAASCGCMGSKIEFPPWAMLVLDAALLAFLLGTRPWRSLPAAAGRWPMAGLAMAAAAALPFWRLRGADQANHSKPPAPAGTTTVSGDMPALPEWLTLEPERWIGKALEELPFAPFVDLGQAQIDATWILYRINCQHCAKHFLEIYNGFSSDPKPYVIVRLPEKNDEAERVVDEALLPPGAIRLELPALARGYDIQTPWEFTVSDGRVTSARHVED